MTPLKALAISVVVVTILYLVRNIKLFKLLN